MTWARPHRQVKYALDVSFWLFYSPFFVSSNRSDSSTDMLARLLKRRDLAEQVPFGDCVSIPLVADCYWLPFICCKTCKKKKVEHKEETMVN